MAENAVFPGEAEMFEPMTEFFRDGRRRHVEMIKMKRIEALSRLVEKRPDLPGIATELQKLHSGGE